jgi:hypothetical protein
MATMKYFIHKEIKSHIHSGNACYLVVQNIQSSHLLSNDIKIKMCTTIILPAVLYRREARSLSNIIGRTNKVYVNRVLRRVTDLRGVLLWQLKLNKIKKNRSE